MKKLIPAVLLAAAALFVAPVFGAAADWPTYHLDNTRSGNDTISPPFSAVVQRWASPALDGTVYASPLAVGGKVIAATLGSSIYALDSATGAQLWRANLGTPTPLVNPPYPCGNVNPVGIIGTPAIDVAGNMIYAVAMDRPPSVPSDQPGNYYFAGVDLTTGAVKFKTLITAPGFDSTNEQQRAALVVTQTRAYVAFGGFIGDCGPYHGWVFGVNKADGSGLINYQVPSGRAAGIWGPSGISADSATGDIFVATGNSYPNPPSTHDMGESVIRLSPTLTVKDYWAPSNWQTLNANDTDIGSLGPALLNGGLVFQGGKEGKGYLLNAGALSANANHIGGEAFSAAICNSIFGGTAYADPFIYVPCTNGLFAIQLGAGPSFSPAWNRPGYDAGPPILSGGVLWSPDHNGQRMLGLDPTAGTLRFTVPIGPMTRFATLAATSGLVLAPTGNQIKAFGQGLGNYHPLVPARILDTRNNIPAGYTNPIGPGGTLNVPVTNTGGVPASGVSAVVLNVTATNTSNSSFLTVYPAGFSRPITSNLNWTPNKTVANLTEVAVGSGGQLSVYNPAGYVDVIFDVAGYYTVPSGTPGPDGRYRPLVPSRILDTRDGTGTGGVRNPIGQGQTIDLQVTSAGGPVPTSGAAGVVLNVTATNPTAPSSFLTVYPKGSPQPNTSNVNFVAGQTVPNRVVVRLGTGGVLSIFNPAGTVDAMVDLNGWFTDTTPGGTGSLFMGLAPFRILDTRDGTGGFSSPVGPGQKISVTVAGAGGVPAMGAPTPPTAVVLNLTVTGPSAMPSSFLTAWPNGPVRPISSDVNFVTWQTVANLVVVQVGSTGLVDIFNAAGSTDVIADVMGWYG